MAKRKKPKIVLQKVVGSRLAYERIVWVGTRWAGVIMKTGRGFRVAGRQRNFATKKEAVEWLVGK